MKKSTQVLILSLVVFLVCFALEFGAVVYYASQVMGFESVMTYFNEDRPKYLLAASRHALVYSLTILSMYALFSFAKKAKMKATDC